MTHKLIWNTTKPVEMRGHYPEVGMRIMRGWWPSVFRGYDVAGRSIAKRDGVR